MPVANHCFYLREFYLHNRLAKGEMRFGEVALDLGRITIPVYELASREDHIAPAASVWTGTKLFGGPVRFVLAGSGHIAGIVNPPEKVKYQHWTGGPMGGSLDQWIAGATETPGSWWPDWRRWLEDLDASRVAARKPGGGRLKLLGDAPGTYVTVQD
jgi:polyhydroxyalkanoate synthase